MIEAKLEGNYTATLPMTCMTLTDRVARAMGLDSPEQPVNDPLQNTSKQTAGKGQNAYSFNSSYLPETGGVATYKGAAALHGCKSPADYVIGLRRMIEHAYTEYNQEHGFDSSPAAYKWGTTCSMTEKFGWKAGLIEDAVENELLEIDGVEPVTTDIEDVPELEKAGKDVVVQVNGEKVGIQVKTGSRGRRKEEDFLAIVDADLDSKEITFDIERV